MLRSLVWTIARRLPGVWWAKSTTTKLIPSIVITIPRRMSVALIIMAVGVAPGTPSEKVAASEAKGAQHLSIEARALGCLPRLPNAPPPDQSS